jgi:RES domain-containing protein
MQFVGTLYRALNPRSAREPLSGQGAARFGGRFNPAGMPALYTATSPITAMREANQAGSFQPITLVAIEANVRSIFDGTDTRRLTVYGFDPQSLAQSDWRRKILDNLPVPTHQLAWRLIEDGYAGILVPTFAPSATPNCRNVVLWKLDGDGIDLKVVDDENRLLNELKHGDEDSKPLTSRC